jgi:hypothetical protein
VIAAVALVVLVVAVAAGVAAFPEILRRVVVRQLAAATGRAVTLAAAELRPVGGRLALRDLRLLDRDGAPLATIERLEASFRPWDLLRGHLRITGASLQAPAVRIVRTGPEEFNVSDLLGGGAGGGAGLAVTVERFELRGGAVAIEDRTLAPPRTWRVEGVTLDARDVSTRSDGPPGVVTLAAVAAGSPISVWVSGVRLAPLRFHATAIARAIDASLAALYLPPGSPLSPVRGTLDLSGTIQQDAASDTRASLDAVFGGIELRQPGQEGASLSAPAVRVTLEDLRLRAGAIELGRLAVDGGSAVLEDARLAPVRRWQADGIALEARNLSSARDAPAGVGSARAVVAGAPLTAWATSLRLAPLELDLTAIVRDVDLALFRLYVPPDLPVQPERGVVNASVRVQHDARRGTRLALDARLAGVEVRRPGHVVSAPALQVTAEDIAFAGGAVTVGRATVGGARLTLEDRTLRPPRTWAVQDLAAEASRLSSRREDVQGVATVRALVAGAAVSAWITHVRLDPLELRATAILRGLDLRLAQLYLPAAAPVQLDRGAVDGSVQVDHDVAGGTRVTGDVTLTGLEARGRGAAAGLAASARTLRVALAGARRHQGTLGVERLELTASGALADTRAAPVRLDFERLRLAGEGVTWPVRGPARIELGARLRDGGELTATGTALLTAPPPMLAWTTDLAVQLQAVDLAPVATALPAAAGLRGRVSGKLTANAAYGASLTARVQGDLDATRLGLAEGGRTLLALRRLEATGLDVQWPERLAARKLRLERPRALVERDRQGAFPLLSRLVPPPAGAGAAPPAGTAQAPDAAATAPAAREASPRALPAVAVDELVVEGGRLALVEAREGAPARLEVPRIDLTLRDARWPGAAPARLLLEAALPEGGTARVEGTVSAEPVTVDVTLALADAGLAPLQPYVPFRAGVRGRVDAKLAVAGTLAPTLRLTARGEATVRNAALSDGDRPAVSVEHFSATGITATWPGRVDVERIRVRRPWALIERDREGRFFLRELLQRVPGTAGGGPAPGPPAAPAAAVAPAAPPFEFRLGEGVFEDGAATVVDAITEPPARFEIAGSRLAVQDLTWPARGPLKLHLTSPTPMGGRLDVSGTLELEPVRLQAHATLDRVEVAPAQPYLPIEGRVAGRVNGDLSVTLALEPLAVRVTGRTRLAAFRLSEGDRPLVTANRLDANGIDVDWPRRVAVRRVFLRRPSLLIERDARGNVALPRLVTPRWEAAGPAAPAPARPAPPTTSPPPARPSIEIGTLVLERASGRFVDQTVTPPYAEQLSRVDVTFTGLTTAPGGRAHFTGDGVLGGGGTFKLEGEAAAGDPPAAELKVEVHDFAIPRANSYLNHFTAWTATRGTLDAAAGYTVQGTRIDARHDIVVRGLEVVQSGASDEVAKRLGLPMSFLVALLKDARGELRLSLPVSGDLSTREFDFREAVWSSVRAVAIRLLALPFSRVGSIFISEDSKVKGVALGPAVFEAGTASLVAAMPDHLDRVAAFLGTIASLDVRLVPISTQADLDALKRERVLARLGVPPGPAGAATALEAVRREHREHWPDRPVPPTLEGILAALAAQEPLQEDAARSLGARRLEVVRQALAARGIDARRLAGAPRRVPLVEAAGIPRVEFDIRP